MKIASLIISLFLFGSATDCALGQANPWTHSWKAEVKVLDEQGQPVEGAKVAVWYYVKPPSGQTEASEKAEGVTDTNGVFTASREDSGSVGLGFQAEKSGYYSARTGHEFAEYKDDAVEKYNPNVTLTLKKVVHPIPMYAQYVAKGPPVFNASVGYDLMVGDWVAPNGKGITTDIVFNGKLDKKAKDDFDYTLVVSFPKPGDGIQEFAVPDMEKGSGLRSPHEVPTNGYQFQVVKTMSRHPGQGTKEDMNDPKRNYFFRVRTALDENGNVVSAHYGKIYGDFMQFTYYLNPTPNSRNIEFDPKQNLIQGLQSFEQVTAP